MQKPKSSSQTYRLILILILVATLACGGTDTDTSNPSRPGGTRTSLPASNTTLPPDLETAALDPTQQPTLPAVDKPQSTYTVQSGDTLGKIAAAHGVTVDAIVEANNIADPNKIAVGTVLVIPDTTITNAPTAAASVPPSDAESATAYAEYKEWLTETTDAIVLVAGELGPLFDEFSRNTNLYFDPEWRTKMGVQLGFLQFIADDIAQKEAPSDLADFHTQFQEIGVELGLSAQAFIEGFDNLEPTRIEDGNQHIRRASTLLADLTATLPPQLTQ